MIGNDYNVKNGKNLVHILEITKKNILHNIFILYYITQKLLILINRYNIDYTTTIAINQTLESSFKI